MADKRRAGIAIGLAILLMVLAALAASIGQIVPEGQRQPLALHGFGPLPLLAFQILLILTLIAYALAYVLGHTRLALIQSIAMTAYGVAMILAGLALLAGGLAAFIGLVSLLLAFPFGTIAYFVQFSCTETGVSGRLDGALDTLGGGCMVGMQLSALVAVALKIAALAALVLAAPGFVKVRGLIVTVALAALAGTVIAGTMWMLSGFHFLLFPADALVTALLGLLIAVYGIVTFVKSLFALALAIAGQVA